MKIQLFGFGQWILIVDHIVDIRSHVLKNALYFLPTYDKMDVLHLYPSFPKFTPV